MACSWAKDTQHGGNPTCFVWLGLHRHSYTFSGIAAWMGGGEEAACKPLLRFWLDGKPEW